jgi:chromosome segregation ATPase
MHTFKGEIRTETAMIHASHRELKGSMGILGQQMDDLHKSHQRLHDKVDGYTGVLEEAVGKIAEQRQDIVNLDNKQTQQHLNLVGHVAEVKQEIVQMKQDITEIRRDTQETNQLLRQHIALPWDKAHPKPENGAA